MRTWVTAQTRTAFSTLLAAGVAVAYALPGTAQDLAGLYGAGSLDMGLLWACGLCAGRGAMILAGGWSSIIGFMFLSTNLAYISGCVGACFGALAY